MKNVVHKLYFDNGSIKYVGETLNNIPNGKGVEYLNDNYAHVEKWKNGDFSEDFGALILELYEGEFLNGKKNGTGSLKTYFYERQFVDGKISDKYISFLGHEYKGQWRDGTFINGEYFYRDKLIDKGKRDGLCLNGEGIVYTPDGKISFEGIFLKGKFNGIGILYFENGEKKYSGDWKNGIMEGNGKLYNENGGLKYQGEWKNGQRHGQGISYHLNGNIKYQGEWKKDKMLGNGMLFTRSGKIKFSGKFLNNKFISDNQYSFDLLKYYFFKLFK